MKESSFSLSQFYIFYTLTGTKAIDVLPYSGDDIEVMTSYDGKTHRLTIDEDKTTFDVNAFKQAVEYLVSKGYS